MSFLLTPEQTAGIEIVPVLSPETVKPMLLLQALKRPKTCIGLATKDKIKLILGGSVTVGKSDHLHPLC